MARAERVADSASMGLLLLDHRWNHSRENIPNKSLNRLICNRLLLPVAAKIKSSERTLSGRWGGFMV